jgi:hypothetical protein
MYIHEEIQRAVLPLLEKYDLELIDLIGELNMAAYKLSILSKTGLEKLIDELGVYNVELTGSPDSSESELNDGLERKLDMAENKAELLAEDIEVLHMNLDHIGIPRDDGHGNIYSMWGRVIKALDDEARDK